MYRSYFLALRKLLLENFPRAGFFLKVHLPCMNYFLFFNLPPPTPPLHFSSGASLMKFRKINLLHVCVHRLVHLSSDWREGQDYL